MAPRLTRMPHLLLRTAKALHDKHFATAPAAASAAAAAAAAAAAPHQTGVGAIVHANHCANAVHHGSSATFVAGPRSFTVSSSTNGSAGGGGSDGDSGGSGGGGRGGGIVELRCYTLKADGVGPYLKATGEFAALRRQLSPGWMGFWTTETGGKLTEVKHLYRYEGGWEHRDAVRSSIASSKEWNSDYLPLVRPHIASMESMILAEASDCMAAAAAAAAPSPPPAAAAPGGAHTPPPSEAVTQHSLSLYELRRYELVAGYHSMPILLEHMAKGLPSRVAAQGRGRCVFMGFSDVGLLNVFLELWRYDSTTDCTRARQGARAADEWRKSIAGIAEVTQSFRTEYLRPTKFSPLQ